MSNPLIEKAKAVSGGRRKSGSYNQDQVELAYAYAKGEITGAGFAAGLGIEYGKKINAINRAGAILIAAIRAGWTIEGPTT